MEWTWGWGKSSRKPVDVGDLKAWCLDRRLGADTGALALQMETPGIHFPHVCMCKSESHLGAEMVGVHRPDPPRQTVQLLWVSLLPLATTPNRTLEAVYLGVGPGTF